MKNPHFKVASFDMFDTLITRNIARPKDIEALLLLDLNRNRSAVGRIATECDMAKQGKPVALREVYHTLFDNPNDAEEAIAQEISIELKMQQPRPVIAKLLKKLRASGARIVVTSDTPFDKFALRSMAKSAGIATTDSVLSSSEEGTSKADGGLFKRLIGMTGATPKDILHVGDHQIIDHDGAKAHGINAKYIASPLDNYLAHGQHARVFSQLTQEMTPAESVALGVIKNRWFDEPAATPYNGDLEKFGYIAYGPVILALSLWILRTIRARGIDRVFCLSRDGFIVDKVLMRLITHYEIPLSSHYLFGSRQFSTLVTLKSPQDIKELLKSRRGSVYERIEAIFGIPLNRIINVDAECDVKLTSDALIERHLPSLMDYAERQKKAYQNYLQDVGVTAGTAIFDIGYQGTTQRALEEITDAKLHGTYLMVFPEIFQILGSGITRTDAFLNSSDHASEWHDFQRYRQLHEAILSAPHGSFIGFDEHREPIFGHKPDTDSMNKVHQGIMSFIDDFLKVWPYDEPRIQISRKFAQRHVHTHFSKPNAIEDVRMLSGISFDDRFAGANDRTLIGSVASDNISDQRLIVWREGTALLSSTGIFRKMKQHSKAVLGTLLVHSVAPLVRSPSKKRKLQRDPLMFFSDSKNPIMSKLAALFY